jgi:hypothetical protein
LIGITGLDGVTGIRGTTGAQGLTGITGVTGLQNSTGIQGLTGAQGLTGLRGLTGIIGVTGLQGLTGAQGLTGVQGLTGLRGLTGLTGVTGLQGVTGVQGLTGIIGNTGAQGLTGKFYGVTGTMSFVMDGGGIALATGVKGDVMLPFPLKIDSWYLVARETGSILVGLWNSSYTNFPPTSANAMHSGATGPTLVNAIKNTGTTANWGAPTGAAYDIMRVNVDSRSTGIGMVSMFLNYSKLN